MTERTDPCALGHQVAGSAARGHPSRVGRQSWAASRMVFREGLLLEVRPERASREVSIGESKPLEHGREDSREGLGTQGQRLEHASPLTFFFW